MWGLWLAFRSIVVESAGGGVWGVFTILFAVFDVGALIFTFKDTG